MWLVERAQVGAVAYGRLQRDGAIRTLIPGLALPQDVPDSPGMRRHVLQRCVPAGCQVTGLGALWTAGFAAAPAALDVRTALGRHVRNWHTTLPLTFHAVGLLPTASESHDSDSVGVGSIGAATADALRWAPLELAVPAAIRALGSYAGDNRRHFLGAVQTHLGDDERACSAWQAVLGALTGESR